ncbi:MAG: ribonuclease [Nitratireductor sp.]|nr:ribonuclease [Nitratireductor sp.]
MNTFAQTLPQNAQPASARGRVDFVLAASWQPGFCETRPGKQECVSQRENRFDATHFSLHGLWPQPGSKVYCGVDAAEIAADKAGRWHGLPALELDEATRAELDRVMPGTQSSLQRHEWIKHGTCHGGSAQAYYAQSLRLMAELNGSAVRALFAARIDMEVTVSEIRAAFDDSFGAGAGKRVKVACVTDPSNGRRLIGEITIGLAGGFPGDIGEGATLAELIPAAGTTAPGCPAGTVDAAGFQ